VHATTGSFASDGFLGPNAFFISTIDLFIGRVVSCHAGVGSRHGYGFGYPTIIHLRVRIETSEVILNLHLKMRFPSAPSRVLDKSLNLAVLVSWIHLLLDVFLIVFWLQEDCKPFSIDWFSQRSWVHYPILVPNMPMTVRILTYFL
jgi:hypothetical protein